MNDIGICSQNTLNFSLCFIIVYQCYLPVIAALKKSKNLHFVGSTVQYAIGDCSLQSNSCLFSGCHFRYIFRYNAWEILCVCFLFKLIAAPGGEGPCHSILITCAFFLIRLCSMWLQTRDGWWLPWISLTWSRWWSRVGGWKTLPFSQYQT